MTRALIATIVPVMCVLAMTAAAQHRPPDNSALDFNPDTTGSEAWRESVEERDRQRVDAAREGGETVIATQAGEATPPAAQPAPPPPDETPPAGPPADDYAHQERPPTIHEPSDVLRPARPGAPPGGDLADVLAILIEEWSREPAIVAIAYDAATAREAAPAAAAPAPATGAIRTAIDAGRPLYARTLYAVNSDYPGPVLLEILEPPLAGAVATGTFTQVRDALVLRLDRIESGGASTPVDGWAVGLDCACFGIEGRVSRHWFERVILPAAISFAQGWARAVARPQTTVNIEGGVVVESTSRATAQQRLYEGIAAAAGPAAAVLQEDAPTRMTVAIPRNTELAVTFVAAADVGTDTFGGITP